MNAVDRSSLRKALTAAAAIVLLAVVLIFRLHGWSKLSDGGSPATRGMAVFVPAPIHPKTLMAGSSVIPSPAPIRLEALTFPCWACNTDAYSWPIEYKTNLDLLAPVGTGKENSARWFADFARPNGPRYREGAAAMNRRIDGRKALGKILPPDDPLLREAELWCDQATMRFYPDVFPWKGPDSQITNLLLALSFAKSWEARGEASPDPKQAMEDFRRAIRLGRLLRQDDAVLITDLVGLACIRLGAMGIYDLARREGNMSVALAASLVLSEGAPQRLRTAEQVTRFDLVPYLSGTDISDVRLALPDGKLDEIIEIAKKGPDRRFRLESMRSLNIARFMGTPAQKEKAAGALASLGKSNDPIIASQAEWAQGTPPSPHQFEQLFSREMHGMR